MSFLVAPDWCIKHKWSPWSCHSVFECAVSQFVIVRRSFYPLSSSRQTPLVDFFQISSKDIISWPAISDIWLGVRTVPLLSVAKEVAAPARSPTGRGAPETGRSTRRTDWSTIECQETFEFCLCVDVHVSFSSKINHRARDAYRVLKADVLRESKNSAWFPSCEIDYRSWPLSVIVRALRGRVRLGKGEK